MKKICKKGIPICLMLVFMFIFIPFGMAKEKEAKKGEELTARERLVIFKAQTAMSEKKPDEALVILEKYIESNPSAVPSRVYELIAYIWLEKEDYDQARKYFKIMVDSDPNDPKALKNYAVLTYQTKRYAEAAILFEKLYDIEESTIPGGTLPQAAQSYMLAEDLYNSKRVLVKLIGLPGKPDPKWYEALINVCLEREEDKDAERYIIDFLHLNPAQSNYWKHLAQIRMKREEWVTATSDLEISHRVEAPKRQNEWLVLGDLYTRAVNAPLMGARCYRLAYEKNNDERGYLAISHIYKAAYRFDEAVNVLDQGIGKNPESAALLLEKGKVLYEARYYKDAITVLEECVKIDPESDDAYFQMGLAAWILKEWDTARSAFVRAKQLSDKYSTQCNSLIDLLDDLNEEKNEIMAAK